MSAMATATFASTHPATGDTIGVHPIHTAADVQAAVTRARAAAGCATGAGAARAGGLIDSK